MERILKFPLCFGVVVALALAALYWTQLAQIFIVEDPGPEAFMQPLMVGYLEKARQMGLSPAQYFNQGPFWKNYKQQESFWAHQCPGNQMIYEFFAYVTPTLCLFYLPFVKIAGVGAKTVALYSTFFSVLAWIGTGLLALRLFGRWLTILCMLLLLSSLSWLIHIKVGYASWMPSVFLMNAIGFCLFSYMKNPRHAYLAAVGVFLGIMYMMSQIPVAFGVLMTGFVILFARPKALSRSAAGVGWLSVSLLITVMVISFVYAGFYHCTASNIHSALLANYFSRFLGGGTPGNPLSISGKAAYAFRCMFIDMETFDHPDKYLEGTPAIPWVFSIFLVVGLLYAIKNRTLENDFLLVWLFSIFGFLGMAFSFTHRYSILAMPAMCILAAQGILGFGSDLARFKPKVLPFVYAFLVCAALAAAIFQIHENYYIQYTLHKPPNLEVDRLRGHSKVAAWLKENCNPEQTLVVLNDPIMFGSCIYYFHTFGHEYRFIFWSNYFGGGGTAAQVKAWERDVFSQYQKIIFVFSTQFYPYPQPHTPSNDWRPFLAAHPGIKPKFIYAYANRPASILLFEVTKE